MPEHVNVVSASFTADVTLVTTTEAVVLTLGPVNTDNVQRLVRIIAALAWTTGAGTTVVEIRVRRDSLTGAVVGEAMLQAVAGSQGGIGEIAVVDEPGESAGLTYVVTLKQTAATGNGAANSGAAVALVA